MAHHLKLLGQIGEGAFSKLFKAHDSDLNQDVALKIEKNNENNLLLKREYEIYKQLQDLSCVPKIYNYIQNMNCEKEAKNQLNCIEMELLGKNLLVFKKTFPYFNDILSYDILIQCLYCIQNFHKSGFIHRDIKPSNFCLGNNEEIALLSNYKKNKFFNHNIKIYLIDFGLVKKVSKNEININNLFVGTLKYASVSSHNNEDLSKKDDLWSFFFMFLEMLNEKLPWSNLDYENEREIFELKKKCIAEPEKYLFLTVTKNSKEINNILNYIKSLNFESEPDYAYISNQIYILKNKAIQKIYYNIEIKSQIQTLQKNLMPKSPTQLYNTGFNSIEKNYNNSSQKDYLSNKLGKSINKSIPSLLSTNYSSSIYYKTNYINCISSNNNENFYQSVLNPLNHYNKGKKLNLNSNNFNLLNKKRYNNNNLINIHPYKIKVMEQNLENQNNDINLVKKQTNSPKKEENFVKHESDKSLIELILGKTEEDSYDKKHNKKNGQGKIIKEHKKKKIIKFSITKGET